MATTYPVQWWATGHPPAVGELTITDQQATLSGVPPYTFDADEAEAVLVTPEPAVHVRVRDRGWLIITTLGSGLAFELAYKLSRLGVA
jgi:hypothetical protein